MRPVTHEEFKAVLAKHRAWLNDEPGGEKANLSGVDLRKADLRDADLRGANLSWANLSGADLRGAGLRGAGLSWANLRKADLRGANLRDADLREAALSGANLREADLTGADLRGADLRWANLTEANLTEANLRGANLDYTNLPLHCGTVGHILDRRLVAQQLYHLLAAQCDDAEVAQHLSDPWLVALVNRSHVVTEHGLSRLEGMRLVSEDKGDGVPQAAEMSCAEKETP